MAVTYIVFTLASTPRISSPSQPTGTYINKEELNHAGIFSVLKLPRTSKSAWIIPPNIAC